MDTTTGLNDTGERMVPEFHKGGLTYAEHLTRYTAVGAMAKGKIVLDIASGSGYGTEILSQSAKYVYGIDKSPEAVEYARSHFSRSNTEYRVGDATKISLDDHSVDLVVTFETIEHVEDYLAFMREIKRVLRPDGIAIISTPNDLEFAEGNHFHLHEFEYDELIKLTKQHFKHVDPYFQATWKAVAIGSEEFLKQEGELKAELLSLAPLGIKESLYFYLLCSNRPISETIKPQVALGGHYSDRQMYALEKARLTAVHEQKVLQATNDELNRQLEAVRMQAEALGQELGAITNSKKYRLLLKLAAAKRRVSGRPSS